MPVSGLTTVRDLLSMIQKSNSQRTVTLGIWALPFKLSELNFANNFHTIQEYSPVPYLPHKVKLHIIQFLLLSRYSLRYRSKKRQLKFKKVSTIFKTNNFVVFPFGFLFSLPIHQQIQRRTYTENTALSKLTECSTVQTCVHIQ